MVRCIAIDMDGTLLNSAQQVTDQNLEAIAKAQSLGIEVVIATGRSYKEARYVLDEAGVSCPVLCVNGAEVRATKGDILASNPLDKEITKTAMGILKDKDIYFETYTNHGTYTIDEDKAVTVIYEIYYIGNPELNSQDILKVAEGRFHKGLVRKIDDYEELIRSDEHEVYKLLAFSFDEDLRSNAQQLLDKLPGTAITSSGHGNIEVNSVNAQKGKALEAFAKEKQIDLEDTVAIGDNYNDISMFEIAGRSVAMGNAAEDIKKNCDFVTLTNNESGVAKAILDAIE